MENIEPTVLENIFIPKQYLKHNIIHLLGVHISAIIMQ